MLRMPACGAENACMRAERMLAMGMLGAVLLVQAGMAASSAEKAKVDLNTASVQELMQVPGMTRTWAARVVRFRPYRAKNNLLDRGVLPPELYDRVKEFIVVHREAEQPFSPQR